MKTTISYLLASLIVISVYLLSSPALSTISNNSEGSNKSTFLVLDPCCNQHNPRSTTAPTYHVYCSGGDIQIDSQCCVNLWDWFGGNPPPTMSCTVVYNMCPESK